MIFFLNYKKKYYIELIKISNLLTPTIRPGIALANEFLASFFLTAINAACGPPYPSGTPKRCALPIATSAPSSPGDRRSVNDNKSHTIITMLYKSYHLLIVLF